MEPIPEVRLWVGLTPVQIDALPTDDGAQPPEPGRFGMRRVPMDAINRAVMFESDDYHPKEFVAMQVFSCVFRFFVFLFLLDHIADFRLYHFRNYDFRSYDFRLLGCHHTARLHNTHGAQYFRKDG